MHGRRRAALAAMVVLGGLLVAAPASGQPAESADGSPVPSVAVPGAGQAFAGTAPSGGETVFNADGRTQVNPTTTYPNRAIGLLTFTQNSTQQRCTGFLIDVNTVLTAGHCVHVGNSSATTAWSTNVEFTPAQNGATEPYGSCGAQNLLALTGWTQLGSPSEDLGFVQLDCNIGATVGWFGYRAYSNDADLLNKAVTVAGYPVDKAANTLWTAGDQVRALAFNSIYHQADTADGEDGGPIYEASGCGGPCALGVNAYEASISATPPGTVNNFGPRVLSGTRFTTIAGVAAANNPRPDALVRIGNAAFAGGNVYNTTAANQSRTKNVGPGGTATYTVRIQNDSPVRDTFAVRGVAGAGANRFTVTWFSGSTNITAQVRSGAYRVTNLAPGAQRDLRLVVKAKAGAPRNASVAVTTTVSSVSLSSAKDVVKATTRRT